MENYFQGTTISPYHLSVGAVVIREDGKVCCHHLDEHLRHIAGTADYYVLMRESVELGETLEEAVHRGLQEEFGITATVQAFLGSRVTHFKREEALIEKTTLYFQCQMIDQDESRREKGIEGTTRLDWYRPEELINLIRQQDAILHEPDVDESEILERLVL